MSDENKESLAGEQLSAFVTIKDTELVALHQQLASAEAREKAMRGALEELAEWGLSADDVVAIARRGIRDAETAAEGVPS